MSSAQRSRRWVDTAPPEEIVKARKAGELDDLIAGRDPGEPLTPEQIDAMSAVELVTEARENPWLGRRLGLNSNSTPASADQGARGERQTLKEWLDTASADEIVEARKSGQLDRLLSGDRVFSDEVFE